MWRTIPVVVLVGSFIGVVGCQNKSLVDGKPKPNDPLLMSKKPVEGRPAAVDVAMTPARPPQSATVPAVDVYGAQTTSYVRPIRASSPSTGDSGATMGQPRWTPDDK